MKKQHYQEQNAGGKPTKKKDVSNPHDVFFRYLLSEKKRAVPFFKGILPDKIRQKVDFKSLRLEKDTYISKEMRQYMSDIVYEAAYGETQAKIALILEHKSQQGKTGELKIQLLGYFLGCVNTQLRQDTEPLAIPVMIVFFHGKESWHDAPLWKIFGEVPDELRSLIPDFEYVLVNISQFSDAKIKNLFDSLELQAALVTMRDIFRAEVTGLFWELFSILAMQVGSQQAREIFIALMNYLGSANKKKYKNLQDKFKQQTQGGGIMNLYQQDLAEKKQEGMQIGIQKGMQKGIPDGRIIEKAESCLTMLKENFDKETILRITKLGETDYQLIASLYKRFGEKAIRHIKVEAGALTIA